MAEITKSYQQCQHLRQSTTRTELVVVTWCKDCNRTLSTRRIQPPRLGTPKLGPSITDPNVKLKLSGR